MGVFVPLTCCLTQERLRVSPDRRRHLILKVRSYLSTWVQAARRFAVCIRLHTSCPVPTTSSPPSILSSESPPLSTCFFKHFSESPSHPSVATYPQTPLCSQSPAVPAIRTNTSVRIRTYTLHYTYVPGAHWSLSQAPSQAAKLDNRRWTTEH